MTYDPNRPQFQPGAQPVYPQTPIAPGQWAPMQAPRKSNTVKVTLIITGAVVGLCVFLGVIGMITGDPSGQKQERQAAAVPTVPTTLATTETPAPLSSPEPDKPAEKVAMPDVRGQNAAVAQDYLSKLGFTQVTFGSQDELDTWVVLPQNWTVKKQSTAPGRKIPADTLIVLTCTKND